MRASIHPSIARGTVAAPPSKSMAHRLLICAGLAPQQTSVIRGVELSDDVRATLACLAALGAQVRLDEGAGTVTIVGVDALAAQPVGLAEVLPCNESGSTLRFFIPLCLLSGAAFTLTGSPALFARPLDAYEDMCREQGICFSRESEASITVKGPLRAGTFRLPGDVSSQFASGLLFALPLLPAQSTIELVTPVQSRSYIELTLRALAEFGVEAHWQGENTLVIPGGQRYEAREITVEGDYSNAAVFDAFNVLGGTVTVTGLNPESAQGDRVYAQLFAQLAAQETPTIDVADCPDLAPVLMALAAAKQGARLVNTLRLAYKESDRGRAMAQELAKFGVAVQLAADGNTIEVAGGQLRAPEQELCAHNDHRIAMALALLCSLTGGTIEGAQAVAKSFPSFFERLARLGIAVELDSAGDPASDSSRAARESAARQTR